MLVIRQNLHEKWAFFLYFHFNQWAAFIFSLFFVCSACPWGFEEIVNTFCCKLIILQFNLVCGRDYLVQLTSTLYMAGRTLGAMSAGILSDRWVQRCAALHHTRGSKLDEFSPNKTQRKFVKRLNIQWFCIPCCAITGWIEWDSYSFQPHCVQLGVRMWAK